MPSTAAATSTTKTHDSISNSGCNSNSNTTTNNDSGNAAGLRFRSSQPGTGSGRRSEEDGVDDGSTVTNNSNSDAATHDDDNDDRKDALGNSALGYDGIGDTGLRESSGAAPPVGSVSRTPLASIPSTVITKAVAGFLQQQQQQHSSTPSAAPATDGTSFACLVDAAVSRQKTDPMDRRYRLNSQGSPGPPAPAPTPSLMPAFGSASTAAATASGTSGRHAGEPASGAVGPGQAPPSGNKFGSSPAPSTNSPLYPAPTPAYAQQAFGTDTLHFGNNTGLRSNPSFDSSSLSHSHKPSSGPFQVPNAQYNYVPNQRFGPGPSASAPPSNFAQPMLGQTFSQSRPSQHQAHQSQFASVMPQMNQQPPWNTSPDMLQSLLAHLTSGPSQTGRQSTRPTQFSLSEVPQPVAPAMSPPPIQMQLSAQQQQQQQQQSPNSIAQLLLNTLSSMPDGGKNFLSSISPTALSALTTLTGTNANGPAPRVDVAAAAAVAISALNAQLQGARQHQPQPPNQRQAESAPPKMSALEIAKKKALELLSRKPAASAHVAPIKAMPATEMPPSGASNQERTVPSSAANDRNIKSSAKDWNGNNLLCVAVDDKAQKPPSNVVPSKRLIRYPCRARSMPMEHNIKTAYFEFPADITHGTNLVCSFPLCRDAGVKFRYCAYCAAPVAKRNFGNRHSHRDRKDPPPVSVSPPKSVTITASAPVTKPMTTLSPLPSSPSKTKNPPSLTESHVALTSDTIPGNTPSGMPLVVGTRKKSSRKDSGVPKEVHSKHRHRSKSSRHKLKRRSSKDRKHRYSKSRSDPSADAVENNPYLRFLARTEGRGQRVTPPASNDGDSNKTMNELEKRVKDKKVVMEDSETRKERSRRWAELLRRRPKTMNGEQTSAWLMEVMSVSDRTKPPSDLQVEKPAMPTAVGPPASHTVEESVLEKKKLKEEKKKKKKDKKRKDKKSSGSKKRSASPMAISKRRSKIAKVIQAA